MGGDGTVPRVSATPIEIQDEAGAMYSNARHASLQNADPVLLQLQGIVDEERRQQAAFRAGRAAAMSVDFSESVFEGEPVRVDMRPSAAPAGPVRARLESVQGEELAAAPLRKQADGAFTGELAPVAPGAYRIRVEGGQGLQPVSDLLAVLPASPQV